MAEHLPARAMLEITSLLDLATALPA
jgi:hypothetical protein